MALGDTWTTDDLEVVFIAARVCLQDTDLFLRLGELVEADDEELNRIRERLEEELESE